MQIQEILSTLVYSAIGIVVFLLTYVIFEKASPFSIRKEIIEDQNTALGIVMGSVVMGLSVIIAAAVH